MTMDERDRGNEDAALRARLDAFAEERLRPDPAAMARIRASVVAEFRARAAAVDDARAAGRPRRGWFAGLVGRPALLAGTGILAVALAAGGVVASGPGGPLYPVRLWIGSVTLPSDPAARAEAELGHLQERLDEARTAVDAGNGDAVSAALEAYRQVAADALAAAGNDPDRATRLAIQLGRHQAVLEALVAALPEQASEAVRASLERTEAKIAELLRATGTPGQPAAPGASPAPAATPPASPGKTPPGKPTPAAEATPKPEHTPPAKPTPAVEATPKPEHTPPGRPDTSPSPTPGG